MVREKDWAAVEDVCARCGELTRTCAAAATAESTLCRKIVRTTCDLKSVTRIPESIDGRNNSCLLDRMKPSHPASCLQDASGAATFYDDNAASQRPWLLSSMHKKLCLVLLCRVLDNSHSARS